MITSLAVARRCNRRSHRLKVKYTRCNRNRSTQFSFSLKTGSSRDRSTPFSPMSRWLLFRKGTNRVLPTPIPLQWLGVPLHQWRLVLPEVILEL
jgi:hypothetical protein